MGNIKLDNHFPYLYLSCGRAVREKVGNANTFQVRFTCYEKLSHIILNTHVMGLCILAINNQPLL